MNIDKYNSFINSKSYNNFFHLFKCGTKAFTNENLKKITGFYVSLIFLLIQAILISIFIILYDYTNNNNKKSNPPKIIKFEIDSDYEEDKIPNQNFPSNNKIDDNKIYIDSKNNLKLSEKSRNKEDGNNQNIDISNNSKKKIFSNIDIYNKKCMIIGNTNNTNSIKKDQQGDINIYNNISRKKRSIKNLKPIQKNLGKNSENFIKQREIFKEDENIKINSKSSKSFMKYYWKLLLNEQLVISLFFNNKLLKFKFLIKIIRIIFVLSLDLCFNIFFLNQKYFGNKYIYFNDKYNIRYSSNKISLGEKFKYGLNNTIIVGLINSFICFFIQLIINYFFFNLKANINTNISRNK